MSHQALARKWRPQRFDDVIGQRGVVETLKNAITTRRLAQAFIFAGPRGVGKTTTARILARALNCVNGPTLEPCGKCEACVEIAEGRDMDVFEIDGATYTGVDAVREVIVEPLGIAPMRDRYKIFIIDEVHRLSKSAFDALLKSIEEPPSYVKFMMATTDLQSVPGTIQSRSQIFELRTLPFTSIRSQLKKIAADEQVKIDDPALALVARSAEGSMRDALSALDQVLAFTSETVSAHDVSAVLGLIGRDLQFDIVETVARGDVAAIFSLAGKVVEDGFDLRAVCRELARLMRDLLVIKIDPARLTDPEIASEGEHDRLKALGEHFSREDLMRAFDLLAEAEQGIKASSQPRHHFEMALVKWIHLGQLTPLSEVIASLEGGRPLATGLKPQPAPELKSQPARELKPQPAIPKPQPPAASGDRSEPQPEARSQPPDAKSAILSAIRETHKVFFGMVVQQAQTVELEGDSLVFTFAPAHKAMRPQLEAKRALIEQLAQQAVGRRIALIVRESAPAPAPAGTQAGGAKADLKARAKSEPSVQAVLDVFGGEIEDVEEI